MIKQIQKSGGDSTNIQVETVNINQGTPYNEVKEIVLDLFKANYLDLSEKAAEIAQKRAEEITEKFLYKLNKEYPCGLNQAEDPDFQYSVFTVQKEYARSGDKELGDLLVDILVDRTKQDQRSILQIVLNESLTVVPKLTEVQLSTLSIIFVFRYTQSLYVIDDNSFGKYLDIEILPFASKLSKNNSCYQHLVYTGCGSISIGEIKLETVLSSTYTGIFYKGFDSDEIIKNAISIGNDPRIFGKCLNDNSKLQILDEDKQKIMSLYQQYKMNEQEIKLKCISLRNYMSNIFDVWDNSSMKNTTLTSVGITIGHGNLKRLIGEFADLSIWIN